MFVASNGRVATFALFLFFSFAEISQTSGNQPNNEEGDALKLFSEHKSRNKRFAIGVFRQLLLQFLNARPTSVSPKTDDDLAPSTHGASKPTTTGGPAPTTQGTLECGTKKPDPRIVGGTNAQPGSWPWQVLLEFLPQEAPVSCGGSILTPYWIVTAAHCFDCGTRNATSFYVLTAGEHDLRTVEGNEQIIPIDKIIVHPNYNPEEKPRYDYDVALIKLREPITFNINVRPVCLPTMDFPPGTNCSVTGWGDTAQKGNSAQEAQVPLVSRETCKRAYSDVRGGITERMRCAGFSQGRVDSCQGDSGGPLVCPSNNKWYLTGIVSWGVGCALRNRFGVYSDMLVLKTWVQETINNSTAV